MTDQNDENPAPVCEARARLAALSTHREQAAARIRDLKAAEALLRSTSPGDPEATAELATLDGAASRTLAEWARSGGNGDAPNPDAAKRDELLGRVSRASARTRAFEDARGGVLTDLNDESRRMKEIETHFDPLVVAVLFAEAAPLVEEVRRLRDEIMCAASRVNQVKHLVTGIAHSAEEPQRRALFAQLSDFSEATRGLIPPVEMSEEIASAHRAEWTSLAARLRGDADAKLEMGA